MPTTVQGALPLGQYQHPDSVARALGPRLGISANHAHQIIVTGNLADRVAHVIEAHKAAGAYDRLERWLAPITAALDAIPTRTADAALVQDAADADAQEDMAEARYLTAPSESNRKHWVRSLFRQARTSLALALGLKA